MSPGHPRLSTQPAWWTLTPDIVETAHGIRANATEATRVPQNPVLPLGDIHEWDALQARPWAGRTVLLDPADGLFKCWYDGTDLSMERWWATGLAISEDGIEWTKPKLGMFSYNESTDNNICATGFGPVVLDQNERDERRRFKMVMTTKPMRSSAFPYREPHEIRVAFSSDGVNWTKEAPFEIPAWNGTKPDVVSVFLDYEEPDDDKRWKVLWQGRERRDASGGGPMTVRSQYLSWGPDLYSIRESVRVLSPIGEAEDEIHFAMLGRAAGHLMIPYECGVYLPDGTGRHGRFVSDIRLSYLQAGSAPGPAVRLSHSPMLPLARHGEWDDGLLVLSDKLISHDQQLYLYYAGCGADWTSWLGDNTRAQFRGESAGTIRRSQMGLARLPEHQIWSVSSDDPLISGSIVSDPIEISDPVRSIWIEATRLIPRRSWVDVTVEQQTGTGWQTVGDARMSVEPAPGRKRFVPNLRLENGPKRRVRLRLNLYGDAVVHGFGVSCSD